MLITPYGSKVERLGSELALSYLTLLPGQCTAQALTDLMSELAGLCSYQTLPDVPMGT